MGKRRISAPEPIRKLAAWARRQPLRLKVLLGAAAALVALVTVRLLIRDRYHFFIASSTAHAAGILVLVYKLGRNKTCSGLSLKSQELTATYLAVRLYCSLFIGQHVHTVLDLSMLGSTLWIIYKIRSELKSTYAEQLDNVSKWLMVVPSIVLAILIHPISYTYGWHTILWAFCVYLEAISVLPQLKFMQNAKMAEQFTAHYVFALGLARFLSCAHWIIELVETRGAFLTNVGSGTLWVLMALLSEAVQTFILADFCYYYIKSVLQGQTMRLPCAV